MKKADHQELSHKKLACIIGKDVDPDKLKEIDTIFSTQTTVLTYLRRDPVLQKDICITIPDTPPVVEFKLNRGEPYGALVAIPYKGKVYVGWSKRCEQLRLHEGEEVRNLYKAAAEGRKEDFLKILELVAKAGIPFKEVEVPFSKKVAKTLAALRALEDRVFLKNGLLVSEKGGPLPRQIAKMLPRFLRRVERVFKKKADNVLF